MSIYWENRDAILDVVTKNIIPTHTVLDIGAGIRPQSFFVPTTHIIVEPFLPYIDAAMKDYTGIPRMVYLNGTWDKVLPFFPDKSVDTIFALDVIEHFEKEDGIRFLQEVERIARKQIVIFTPLGMYPQEDTDDNPVDRWGMLGGYWQSHRSGWEPSEFGEGWKIFACKDFHVVDQHNNETTETFGAFWAIKIFSSQSISTAERLFISELNNIDIVRYGYHAIKSNTRKKISKLISIIGKEFSNSK